MDRSPLSKEQTRKIFKPDFVPPALPLTRLVFDRHGFIPKTGKILFFYSQKRFLILDPGKGSNVPLWPSLENS